MGDAQGQIRPLQIEVGADTNNHVVVMQLDHETKQIILTGNAAAGIAKALIEASRILLKRQAAGQKPGDDPPVEH